MHLKGLAVASLIASSLIAGPLDEWHSRTNFGAEYIHDIAYGLRVWVIVDALPGEIITTTADLTRGALVSRRDVAAKPHAVEFGAGRFVVACKEGGFMSSPDGTNWTTHAVGAGLTSLLYANGRFVAVGSSMSASSTNGTNWTVGAFPALWSGDLSFGNGVFMVGGGPTNAISTDGITWEMVPSGIPAGFYTSGFGEGKFVGITAGANGNPIWTSPDARTWTRHGTLDVLRPGRIMWGNGYFVTAGGSARAYSQDGISWTVMASGTTEYNVEFIHSTFIATGYKTIYQSSQVIELMVRTGGELQVLGESGKQYRIESSNDLKTWETNGTARVLTDEAASVFRPHHETPAPRQFFRAVLAE